MTGRDLIKLGFKPGPTIGVALRLVEAAQQSGTLGNKEIRRELKAVLADPVHNAAHPYFSELARMVREESEPPAYTPRADPAPYQVWGDGLEEGALEQMRLASLLPVATAGALMPDAHVGYGLPIGGVLATDNAVIPYAVGVDIACRMRLSVYDVPADQLKRLNEQLVRALHRETKFGTGQEYKAPLQHDVLDEDWNVTPVTAQVFDKARRQLGTSGSGNHFVEFGVLTLEKPDLGLRPGQYLALLSHSGSRGAGATVADFYSRRAMEQHPELPQELRRLAWLDLDSDLGQQYWAAMELMGKYAAANHAMIHQRVAKAIGAEVIAGVENHHNFCIPASERIPTPKGPTSIRDLKAGAEVYSFDAGRGLVRSRVRAAWQTGRKRIYTVRTRHRCIRVSENHPILVAGDCGLRWVPAGQLRKGDPLVCAEGYYRRSQSLPPGQARFIGAFIGDGWVRRNPQRQGYSFGLAIGKPTEAHTLRYASLISKLETPPTSKTTWKRAALRLKVGARGAYGISASNKAFYRLIGALGLAVESTHRRVPACVFSATKADKLEFLAGYMDADGSIGNAASHDGSGVIRACGEGLVADLRDVAISAGLDCTNLRRKRVVTNYGTTEVFMFNICPCGMKQLDLWHERKRAATDEARVRSIKRPATLPKGTFAEKVTTIEVGGEEDVWDLEVDHESHSFVCEGIVVHNCWREIHNGKEVCVHRKGATPAGKGVLGVIPGSMASPGFVVRGRGNDVSLQSASHGAGRRMSRTAARNTYRWNHVKPMLEERGVQLLSAGIDENPFVYKPIEEVMAAQQDLVDVVARFDPKIVKMSDDGKAED